MKSVQFIVSDHRMVNWSLNEKKKTPHISSSRVSYEMSIVSTLVISEHLIMRFHNDWWFFLSLSLSVILYEV